MIYEIYKKIIDLTNDDPEASHMEADECLLKLINDLLSICDKLLTTKDKTFVNRIIIKYYELQKWYA